MDCIVRNGTLGNLNFGSESVLFHDSKTSNPVDRSEVGRLAVCFQDPIEIILQPRMIPRVFAVALSYSVLEFMFYKPNIFNLHFWKILLPLVSHLSSKVKYMSQFSSRAVKCGPVDQSQLLILWSVYSCISPKHI